VSALGLHSFWHERFGNGSFRHGIHPPELKDATRALPIRAFPFAPVLVVPLLQHLGKPAIPTVAVGERVERGQPIARPDGFMSVAMHAPVAGTVRAIEPAPSIQGKMLPAVFLETRPGSTQEVCAGDPCSLDAPPEQILRAIQQAGVVGLGGAAFPTHVKLSIPEGAHVDTLILNGAECEPYLTTDHRVMLEQQDDLFTGVRYLLRVSRAKRVILAIERNKHDAATELRASCPADLPISIEELQVKYPQGAEKMLIQSLLGREIASGALPISVHALVVNVATAAEIGRLLPDGRGVFERVITVSGPGIERKGNYRISIGTPLRFVLDEVRASERLDEVFLGGPMMGVSASSLDIPLTKGISGVIALPASESAGRSDTQPCIRCARCIDACPMLLDPAQLLRLGRARRYATMADEFHLMDCFECGCCSYVCPSRIPLTQHFRVAKAARRREQAA